MPGRKSASIPSGNFGLAYEGHLHSEEGFLEVAIPILKNDIVDSLSIDLAGRMTHYSFSGLSRPGSWACRARSTKTGASA